MSEAYGASWPFGGRGSRRGGGPRRWMRMAAERGGHGPGGSGRGAGPAGFWGDPRGGAGPFRPPFPPFHGGFGPASGHHGGRGWFHGGPKVRRGDVRASVLALLAEEPRNGYQIIQEIEERSGGVWRPSAGSVYPALQQLEDEDLVRAVESGARRVFELTAEGRKYVEAHVDECSAPWEAVYDSVGEQAMEMRNLIGGVAGAAIQVLQAGSASQVAEVRRILTETRRSLYRILAEDDPDDVAEDTE